MLGNFFREVIDVAAKKKAAIKRETIKLMQSLGVYKPEYDPLIEIYAELREQYAALTREFVQSGYQYQVSTDQGGSKKAPIVAALESLRKDILAYADRLCLSPKALENVTAEKGKTSALAAVLREMDG